MFSETFQKQDTAFEFTVNGAYQDSITYERDTTWRYTDNDTTALMAWTIDFFNNAEPPQVVETVNVFPPYNLYDTAQNGVDTQMLANPDTALQNSKTPISYEDTRMVKRQVVDTLFLQVSRERLNDRNPTSMISGFFPSSTTRTDTVRFVAPPYSINSRKSSAATMQETILLTNEDSTGSSLIGRISESIGLTANNRLGEEIVMAATITFRPGYKYKPTDTLLDARGGNLEYKNNSFRVIRYIDESGFLMQSVNNGMILANPQIYNNDSYDDEDLRKNFYIPTNSPLQSNGQPSNMTFFDMSFHLTATNTGIEDQKQTQISTAYPNPAATNSTVHVELDLDKPQRVSLSLYNTLGQPVKELGSRNLNVGKQTLKLSTDNLDPGVYFLNVQSDDHEETTRISIVN